MKIAVTADNHIIDQNKHSERLATFGNILIQCGELNVDLLVIAGDLFDKDIRDYRDFENIFASHRPENLNVIVIPGNHDAGLVPGMFSVPNFSVITEPEMHTLDNGIQALFIPYKPNMTMGEALISTNTELKQQDWLLFGHGDWTEGLKLSNTYEQGGYMPLTKFDVLQTNPFQVFLGHIHLPYDGDGVYYPGSPCPVDITETGLRRLLVFDTNTKETTPQIVDSPTIFFNESFIVLPDDQGLARLEVQMKSRIQAWDCPKEFRKRIVVRVVVRGFASDRAEVKKLAETVFSDYGFYDQGGANVEEVIFSDSLDLAHIAHKFMNWFDQINWPTDDPEPSYDEVILKALEKIYGV